MFVALSIADWPTGAAANDLLAQLLAVAPRAAVSPGEQLAWLDARGLDAAVLVQRAVETLAEIGIASVTAGVAAVPIVAMVAAAAGVITQVPPGTERSYLAPLPLEVLSPPRQLLSLCAGVGLERCGELARLSRESVEVRFGREGVALWRLARADDRRPVFSSRPRELPNASLDWTEFSTTDLEQLVFVLHSLLKTVCDTLAADGTGARSLTLTLILENRTTIQQPVGAARATAQRTTWLRLMRRALERITLPDRVTGIAVQVDALGAPAVRQGDLFDLGFASAQAAERAVGHLMDLQPDAVVALQRTGHPLPERSGVWGMIDEPGGREPVPAPAPRADADPALHPMLLPAPREVTVLAQSRRGYAHPFRYTDNGVAIELKECLGPHCISGEHWAGEFDREYHQGVRADGLVVLLYRDVPTDRWYLAGWWD